MKLILKKEKIKRKDEYNYFHGDESGSYENGSQWY